ncbi:Dabb family protein [Kineococcus rhizosphaerae]|uniref:Stress responsive alpha/beta barrel protein n=1 Tax=Kineococcus rhizosphaerae TaxID=559628 RepID=A0A2T0R246_9ACTN|nr:Dabb family protein [Kineococcus rhizosphaerae]PRY13583.1 stress responsive alpha/beta barrel protein [Kineococcus rhizosphaerae]
MPASALASLLADVGVPTFTARDFRPGLVRHVVLFRYREEVGAQQKEEVLRRFRALAGSPRDGAPYVVSIEAGEQTSGEDAGGGFEHGVVVTFASEGDRNFYVGTPVVDDPAFFDAEHARFKDFVGPLLADVLVFDVVVPG